MLSGPQSGRMADQDEVVPHRLVRRQSGGSADDAGRQWRTAAGFAEPRSRRRQDRPPQGFWLTRKTGAERVYYGLGTDKLNPVIDRMFALEDIVGAYRYLESNAQVGKVIVRTR
jgi:hypothetical protein